MSSASRDISNRLPEMSRLTLDLTGERTRVSFYRWNPRKSLTGMQDADKLLIKGSGGVERIPKKMVKLAGIKIGAMRSILYYTVAIAFTVTYFVIFSLLFLLTVLFDKERVVMHYASVVWARAVYGLNPWWRMRVSGKENIERGKAYVIVNNHQSMLDIPLMYTLPLTFKWVAKKEVLNWPVFGLVMRMHGDIAIERGAASGAKMMIRKGCKHLAAGTSVIMFPEGTRSRDGRVGRFKEGAFTLAKTAGVDILPCAIEGTGSFMDGWKVRMPHAFHVRILPPIASEGRTAAQLAELAHNAILKEHKKLRSDLYKE